jgi:hypothetical protein
MQLQLVLVTGKTIHYFDFVVFLWLTCNEGTSEEKAEFEHKT